ncbi:MAG: histidinol dehydrogenase [Chloroflexi bacterium]|nr:histidinol dehydrogenase [Chloroflexota bacterium]
METPASLLESLRRVFGQELTPEQVVNRILADVRRQGDAAVRDYTKRIDGRDLTEMRVPVEAIEAAAARVSPALLDALKLAAGRIRIFHERARRNSWIDFRDGGALGQLIRPLQRVGVYAPGGRAPYPSTLLMAAVPARVAGVKEIVLASPPQSHGEIADVILAAAHVAGVDEVYRVGGAQAIGAMAYGTETLPRVDKVVGPGNLFVALAKRAVFGIVGIDGVAGPTECLLIADGSADPRYLAADLIAQAEHDPLAQPILLVTERGLAERTLDEIEQQVAATPRREIVEQSLQNRGVVVIWPSVDDLIELANEYAPEHLTLCIAEPWSRIDRVRNAGGIFIGEGSAEAIGDYIAGPSHVMPTSGTARFSSPLGVDDFLKITSVFSFAPGEIERIGPPALEIARAEGLEGHAQAIERRLGGARG